MRTRLKRAQGEERSQFLLVHKSFRRYPQLNSTAMSSTLSTVFRFTIGLLVNKGRDKVAGILKDGDVTDQNFRSLIVREIEDIKSMLDALSMKDLEASISFFEEGLVLLYEVFEIANAKGECGAVRAEATLNESIPINEGIRKLELTSLNESATRKLSTAKKRFDDARREATRAFKNEGLDLFVRILAMKYRVMATILETVDNPADALGPCKVCVKELNSLSEVQNNFGVQFETGILAVRGWFHQEERREIVSSVCHVNRVIYDVTRTFGGDTHFWIWPTVDTRNEKINPLYDARVTEVLVQQGMEHCCVTPWSFGQEGEEAHKLKHPLCIATISSGEFFVEDSGCLKVFDRNGKFVKRFRLPTDDVNTLLCIQDVATDMNDNIFVLTILRKPEGEDSWWVYKLTKTADLHFKFRLLDGDLINYIRLCVSDKEKVMTLTTIHGVLEYNSNGELVCGFGRGILKYVKDITVTNDGCVLVVDSSSGDEVCINGCPEYIHIFSEHGDHLKKFELQRNYFRYKAITFHPPSEQVVVAGRNIEESLLQVRIYRKDGEFVRSLQIQYCHHGLLFQVGGIALINDGRIAVTVILFDAANGKYGKVIVL